ncbi:MAG: mechanosensitive ion channel, partial [Desulfobacterales bacterium]
GIAYGSDTDLAEALLLNAARENPMVLEEPAPSAIFTGFGDNSLNFEVRAFINNINNWYPMVNRLNRQINNEFKKAGITIAFPQRDVHLDTSNPLEIRVVSGTA